jgi:acetyl-CoA carboxylase carboxyltransferase component
VRAAVGEDVTQEELGGSRVHCRRSGVGDLEVADDEIARIREYFASSPPTTASRRRAARPPTRSTSATRRSSTSCPSPTAGPTRSYDVIRRIVDDGAFLDPKPRWARNIVTCLARFGGRPAGVVANQPRQLGGILDNDAADKAAGFVSLCNAFGLPLVFLQDGPGFMVGTKVEAGGIIRHGAKMLRRDGAEGDGRPAQGVRRRLLRHERPRLRSRPHRPLADRRDQRDGRRGGGRDRHAPPGRGGRRPRAKARRLIGAYRQIIDVYVAAKNGMIDDVIDPPETRPVACRALEMAEGKTVERPWKRNAVVPA